MKMKRKRRNVCSSPILDDSPKRTKVHAQRKFAQGSNVNSPVITPIQELEADNQKSDNLPEPVELLPIKRPNTEDFLTFLCFRGTPILPPTLNFFNTASIVDTNGQVHEIKSETSPKNGPIDIAKCGSSSEKPFVAFGVRKRADPVVISRQMDRKRRHALALQALRRKYQEQKMAKIRALTISKLSEKVTNKMLVRTNTVSKTETITKKTNTVQKTKVVATKHIKVTTRTLKTTLKPKLKQSMCLRSFRGRFIQQELPFKRRMLDKQISRTPLERKSESKKKNVESKNTLKQDKASSSKQVKPLKRKIVTSNPSAVNSRFTRSSLSNTKSELRRKQIKRILIPSTNTIIKTKPRSLRLTTMKKSVLSRRKNNSLKLRQKMRAEHRQQNVETNKSEKSKRDSKMVDKKDVKQTVNKNLDAKELNRSTDIKKDYKRVTDLKKEVTKTLDGDRKRITRSVDIKKEVNKSTDIKRKPHLTEIKRSTRVSNIIRKKINSTKNRNKDIVTVKSNKAEKNRRSIRKSDNFNNVDDTEIEKTSTEFCEHGKSKEKKMKNTFTLDESKIISEKNIKKCEENEKLKESIENINIKLDVISAPKDAVNRKDNERENNKYILESSNTEVFKKDLLENDSEVSGTTVKLTKIIQDLEDMEVKDAGVEKKVLIETKIEADCKEGDPLHPLSIQKENVELKVDPKLIVADVPEQTINEQQNVVVTTILSTQDEEQIIKETIFVQEVNEISKKSKRDTKKHIKDNIHNRKIIDHEESVAPKSQRPSRKTKEAAAIYMEILSHKLVNDDKVDDDDTISIDSFPELPNVKRTEQREIELKAKVKISKDKIKQSKLVELKHVQSDAHAKDTKMYVMKRENENIDGISMEENIKPKRNSSKAFKKKQGIENSIETEEISSIKSDISQTTEILQKSDPLQISEDVEKSVGVRLRKSDQKIPESNDYVKPRRLTRHSLLPHVDDDYDSDESFHINVKVPRKKKNTRSRVSSRTTKGTRQLKLSSSESDQSTTSDVNIQPSMNKFKSKKYSKTKSMKVDNLSETDNELSDKCQQRKIAEEIVKDAPKSKRSNNQKSPKSSNKGDNLKFRNLQNKPDSDCVRIEPKPKRECAKLPQNYLPMFSSSDEEEIFHGFDEKTTKNTKTCETACTHAPPLLDFLNKDLGRRFGKEKVNMSNEQIEKWLKDAALAGNSIKKENDEMLKFGERIPTETNLEVADTTDTEKLEQSSELDNPDEDAKDPKINSKISTMIKPDISKMPECIKAQLDRKLIFRKSKINNIPNVNAFSPENESSVYAFGEENEDVISTPFRRPSRRPSSTATSKSEDESGKHDEIAKQNQFRKPTAKQETPKVAGVAKDEQDSSIETEDKQFYVPQKPTTKTTLLKNQSKPLFKSKSSEKLLDTDEIKYKIPSSPSASSSSSANLYKRQPQKIKCRSNDFISPIYVSDFPKQIEPAKLVEAPIFHPTDQEFQDPLEYIERIRHKAEQFGICKIVPPSSFKPECKVTDDMRFTAYNQYINKMLYRWGPNYKELMAIKKYLETQNIALNHPPWIGGMEIDLPRLYQTVQSLGGLREVIEKKKWPKVSDLMKIPKSAQDRVTKLDDIYCKYLLPYDILSPAEREKLFNEVETEWAKKESRLLSKAQNQKLNDENTSTTEFDMEENDSEECITKGRNMALNAFFRIARNTMSMYFKTSEPSPQEVEQEYWKYVTMRQNHICVHSGSIDCGNWGYGFAVSKNSPFAKHPWNLKVLTNNSGSVLRCLGPVMGVTVPTLHVGMIFSACCWYRDPHGLPWIEYLHTGGSKIWYGIPNSMGEQFHNALSKLTPSYVKDKELWLPSDTVMVPPNLLVENQVSLCHTVQEPGQFIVVFPKAFTSSISTGYVVSESVYFAPIYWLKTANHLFNALKQSNEPAMFSFERLVINVANDSKCSIEIIRQVIPLLQELCNKEIDRRKHLYSFGEAIRERLPIPEINRGKKKKFQGEEGDYECEICGSSLFLSMIFNTVEGITYCLDHARDMIDKKTLDISLCKFMFTYDDEELEALPERTKTNLENRLQKKISNKFSGLPTLLGK
ncbi:uncharacterized protein LOC130440524 [Diorhabda sublineata]|uniref:uncharacterized protein LOC130440524 n=1 Tax=Diorhabda sublineata TaxID=1163346 RepID=UPI0024E10CFA|nr:uncharacterized protein LOC130440524 [Diorhabda sublineata]